MSEAWQKWLAEQRAGSNMSTIRQRLDEIQPWSVQDDGTYGRADGKFFRLVGVSVGTAGREVEGWGQPLIEEQGGDGAVMIVLSSNHDVLVTFKAEPGNTEAEGHGYLAPTLQASWDNLNRAHGGLSPTGAALTDDDRVRWVRFAKDGGRHISSFNRLGVLIVDSIEDVEIAPGQRWFTRDELRDAMFAGECNSCLREVIGLAFV